MGLGLTLLPLQTFLEHLPSQTKNALLRSSLSVRHEILMCAHTLRLRPNSASSLASRRKQLNEVLQERKWPLQLRLDMDGTTEAEEEQMTMILAEAAAISRPAHNGSRRCCVDELVVEVRSVCI